MKRGLLPALTLLLFFLFPVFSATAEDGIILRDDLDLLTAEQEAELLSVMKPICSYGTPMFWSTDQDGNSVTDIARTFYRSQIGTESGTLFMINMKKREICIFSDGRICQTITPGEANTITDNVYRLASKEEYFACARKAFLQIRNLLAGQWIAHPMKVITNLSMALCIALIFVYFIVKKGYEYLLKEKKDRVRKDDAIKPGNYSAVVGAASLALIVRHQTDMSSSDSGGGGGSSGGGGSRGGGGGSSGGGGSHGF